MLRDSKTQAKKKKKSDKTVKNKFPVMPLLKAWPTASLNVGACEVG